MRWSSTLFSLFLALLFLWLSLSFALLTHPLLRANSHSKVSTISLDDIHFSGKDFSSLYDIRKLFTPNEQSHLWCNVLKGRKRGRERKNVRQKIGAQKILFECPLNDPRNVKGSHEIMNGLVDHQQTFVKKVCSHKIRSKNGKHVGTLQFTFSIYVMSISIALNILFKYYLNWARLFHSGNVCSCLFNVHAIAIVHSQFYASLSLNAADDIKPSIKRA